MAKKTKSRKTIAGKPKTKALKPDGKTEPKTARQEYNRLRRAAYEYVVLHNYDQKDVANMLGVSQTTLSKWSKAGKWREEREARQQCYSTDSINTKKILRLLSERRLELELEIRNAEKAGDKETELKLRNEARGLSDEISKHNKALQTLTKENRISLGVYIDVMDDVFNALRLYNEDLYLQCVDFQAQQIRKKTIELG